LLDNRRLLAGSSMQDGGEHKCSRGTIQICAATVHNPNTRLS